MGKNYRPGKNKKDLRALTSKGDLASNHGFISEHIHVAIDAEDANRAQKRRYLKKRKPKVKL